MLPLKDIYDQKLISREIGAPYPFLKKLKLGGTGSPKIVYLDGIPFFQSVRDAGQDLDYLNFELYPDGLIGRYNKRNQLSGVLFTRKELHHIHFLTLLFKVRTMYGLKEVEEAVITFQLITGEKIRFYVPVTFYKALKPFFLKDWLRQKISFEIKEADRPVDSAAFYLEVVGRILGM